MESILLFLAQPFFLIFDLFVNLKVFLSTGFLYLKEDVPAIITILNFAKDSLVYYLSLYKLIFTLRFLLMWFPNINPFVAPFYILRVFTEPLIERVRKRIPPLFGLDFSFFIASLGVELFSSYLAKLQF
jgi:uncharacterized protein YggT (Ycf19 family)